MDHGMHTMPDHSMHDMSMSMYFNTDLGFNLLFKAWLIDTTGKLAGACVGIFILAVVYEAMKFSREHLLVRNARKCHSLCKHQPSESQNEDCRRQLPVPSVSAIGDDGHLSNGHHQAPLIQSTRGEWTGYCSPMHILQTILHVVQLFISYILMLVFMTYNVYLCLSIALGAGLGYFLFFRERFVFLGNQECCH